MQLFFYVIFRFVALAVEQMSPRMAWHSGRLFGRLMYFFYWDRRKLAHENILKAEGMPRDPEAVDRLVRRCFEHLGLTGIETLLIQRIVARGVFDKHVILENKEILDEAMKGGRGAIMVCAHVGNWELSGLAMARRYKITSIARTIENPWIDAYVTRRRGITGASIVSKHDAVRPMVQCLRSNGLLGILVDQKARKNGVVAPFFGRPALTVRSPATLALKFGSPIVPVCFFRENWDRHRVVVTSPIEVEPGADVEDIIARINARIESFVRAHPEQWLWVHDRWKMRSSDVAEVPVPAPVRSL